MTSSNEVGAASPSSFARGVENLAGQLPTMARIASSWTQSTKLLGFVFVTRSSVSWLALLAAGGVPCAPVNSVAEGLVEHRAAGGRQIETQHPRFGTVRHAGPMIRVGPELHEYPPAPTRGQHTVALLGELGYDRETIDELYRAGAFGETKDGGTT